MTDTTFYITQHDLMPYVRVLLLDEANPVDLLNAMSVSFLMSNRKVGLKVDAAMVIADQTIPANLGVVAYEWVLGDTDTVGDYTAEIKVNWPGSLPQTFPANSYMTVSVRKELG
jgi:hypothetical protein